MNFRKHALAFSSFVIMLLWGIIVVLFCHKYLSVIESIDENTKLVMAKYGIVLTFLLFHLTWTVVTIDQSLMAYAISKDIGDSYINRLNSEYKYHIMFAVVDIGYMIFFAFKFGEYFI
jgi:hypothetical protein